MLHTQQRVTLAKYQFIVCIAYTTPSLLVDTILSFANQMTLVSEIMTVLTQFLLLWTRTPSIRTTSNGVAVRGLDCLVEWLSVGGVPA